MAASLRPRAGRPGGGGGLGGGGAKRPPGHNQTHERAPAGARGDPATPAGVRIVVSLLPGGSLRSPPAKFHPPRWGGILHRIYETVSLVNGLDAPVRQEKKTPLRPDPTWAT